MVKVECEGCKAPYQVDEKRIPPGGLKMRCPKCGTSFVVARPGEAVPAPPPSGGGIDLPAPVPPRPGAPRPAPPKVPARVPPPQAVTPVAMPLPLDLGAVGDDDLPAVPDPNRGVADLPATRAAPPPPPPAATQRRQAFGEIDLMVDLPNTPAPSAPAPALPELGVEDLPVVHAAVADGPEIEIDLPMTAPAGLPAPRPVAPVAPPPPPPAPARKTTQQGGFGEIDLPLTRGQPPAPPPPPPSSGGGFGEIDLPIVSADMALPVAAGVGLPSPVHAGLPMAASAGLPIASGAGLPVHAGAGLPSNANAVGMPTPATAVGMPAAATGLGMPSPATGLGMPSPATGLGMPSPATGLGMPSPATGLGMPSPATSLGMPASAMASGMPAAATNLGMPSASAGLPSPFGGSVVGAELYTDPLGQEAPAPAAFLRQDSASGAPRSASIGEEIGLGGDGHLADSSFDLGGMAVAPPAVGDEIELASNIPAPPSVGHPRPVFAPPIAEPAQVKKPGAKRFVLAALAVALMGGAALGLLPDVGPFGIHFIGDLVSAPGDRAALDALRKSVQAELDADTAAAAGRAYAAAKNASSRSTRHRDTAAYAAFVALSKGIRFGRGGDEDAWGRERVTLAAGASPDLLGLATAAQDATSGQLARARQTVAGLAARSPNDVDVAVLAGEIELLAKAPDKAVAAWKQAVAAKKSARTLFGLARAQLASDDGAAAGATAKEVLAASPAHVGARILQAQLAFHSGDGEKAALELLEAVTKEGEVRAAAGNAELVDAYTLIGRIHLARSRMTQAEQAFAGALKLSPQAVQALLGNGELNYRAGRYSEAQAKFEAAIQADPDSLPAMIGRAKSLLMLERMKEAKELLKKLREGKPKEPAVAYWLGRAEEALGNKKEAELAYLEAIKIGTKQPEVVDAYVALARLLSGLGRNDDATGKLAEATAKFPDSPALSRAKGDVFLQIGRYEEAKRELEAALAKDDDLGTRFKLGVTLRRMRMFDDALKVFDGISAVDKEYPGLALERGLYFEETGQSEKALEMYADALRKAPDDIDLKLRVASTQVMAGHAKQAEPVLREILKARPNSAEANHFLGRALLVKGTNLADAIRVLEMAVAQDPNRAEYHLYVGWAANDAGRPDRAAEALKKAIELDRDLGDAYWQRGVLLQKQGVTKDALADLQTALAKRPSRFEAYATMAACYSDLGQWDQALEAWRKAIAGNDKVAEWHFRLAKIYIDRGNRAAAGPELELAAQLHEAQPERTPAGIIWPMYYALGEHFRAANNNEKAADAFHKFLNAAPAENHLRGDIEKYLDSIGKPRPR